jgi:MSHA pilin protein MshA
MFTKERETMKRQGGFTLIELVVVIVILGILAVTAAPRFLNLQNDARKASIQGLKGAIDGAAGITYGKAAVEGVETATTSNVDGSISAAFGYPTATDKGLGNAVVGLDEDWSYYQDTANKKMLIGFKQDTTPTKASDITDTNCYVEYAQATDKTSAKAAKTTIKDSGC